MTDEELKDGICEYVHNLHKVEPFNGFSYRDLRDVAEHFALPREKRIVELETRCNELFLQTIQLNNAKEIIRDLINLTEPTSTEEVQHWNETFRKAEQFLKDCEVE